MNLIEQKRAYNKAYFQRPEIKEKRKAYIQQPKIKERTRIQVKARNQRSEIKEQSKAYSKVYNQRPEVKDRKLQKKYGLTLEAFNFMLAGQGFVCVPGGIVRGILCGKCNTAIGLLDDNPVRARRLADYLEKSR